MTSDTEGTWHDFPMPVLRMTQGDRHLALPIYQDMRNPEGLASMVRYMDRKLLEAVGYVLPSRVWWVTNSARS